MNRISKVVALLAALIVATCAGVALTGPASAQTPACWDQAPTIVQGTPKWPTPPNMVIDPAKIYTATIQTSLGDITVSLLTDRAPIAVNNFVCLARAGFYNVVPFHRVMSGFMIQSGDPTGTGAGNPGYQFNDELPGEDLNYDVGTLAMANSGPNTNGSQFFIMHGTAGLEKNYTIFGKVTSGQDVVDAIAAVPVGPNERGEQSSPLSRVGIFTVTIAES